MFQRFFGQKKKSGVRSQKPSSAKPSKVRKKIKPIIFKTKSGVTLRALPIGKIDNFYGRISVITFTLKRPLKVGDWILIKGESTKFLQQVSSMQRWHKPIETAARGEAVGIQVKAAANVGDRVYRCVAER
ncbi:MAG TPA: hypothetical protein VJL87_07675 [Bdellovibrionota bacterium]|nr:hypothetical protein [Bdellovibrionota bacterium]